MENEVILFSATKPALFLRDSGFVQPKNPADSLKRYTKNTVLEKFIPERFSSVATIELDVPPMSLWKAMTGFLSGDYQSWGPGLISCLNPEDASKELSRKIYKFSSADNEIVEVSLKKFLTDKDSKYYLGEYEIEFSKSDVVKMS